MSAPEPLEVEMLLDADNRRVTVDEHQAFHESISPQPPVDPIDELVAEIREIKPEGIEP